MASAEILARLTGEVGVSADKIMAVERLLADGNTVPFIARYRKEAHGNLDEVQIGKIQDRLGYYKELEDRRATILKSIDEQGKLTDELRAKIESCFVKTALEDLYQPYKPKRRTRAQVAKEKGFEPLADQIWNGEAFETSEEDLQYARDIIAERIADIADVRGLVRNAFATASKVKSEVASPKPTEPTKFEQYYDFEESISTIPSHRYLAIRRGQKEGVLWVKLVLDPEPVVERMLEIVAKTAAGAAKGAAGVEQIEIAARDAYKRLLAPSCEIDVTVEKKMESDRAAVEVFAENLRHLLLASPLGEKAVLAIDPGIRTGCKVAMMDATGKYLGKTVIFPMQKPEEAAAAIKVIATKYRPEAIAVGNGTAGRETEAFVRKTLKEIGRTDIIVVSVSESGASVYSASEIARKEFPDLDLTVRGAISIGRRLQDPLAELVKIDPKAIGVGQYQHDVHQPLLGTKLDEVVVSCVNGVGVELNTASAPLLERVSGVGAALAKSIVEWRNENGKFSSREDLRKVKGLGDKAFEQCAGFLRIRGAANPLDSSAVHPERYSLVEQMAADVGVSVGELVGNATAAKKIDIRRYIAPGIGEPTLKDIVAELVKPGRDPRKTFEPPKFRDDVTKIEDVREGMKLEGVVTNVTAFGAFVDIGVHQDGLIHVSELSDNFVTDPASVVKAGDRLSVTVIGIDKARGRISLSAKSKPGSPGASGGGSSGGGARRSASVSQPSRGGFSCNPFANLMSCAMALFMTVAALTQAVAAPWMSQIESHQPPKTMGRDYWTFFHEWRYSHPRHPLSGAWDNKEIANLPMFRDCGLVYYSGNLSLPPGKGTWRKVIGNFGGENGVWKRFESDAKRDCPATMLFHPKCRHTPAMAGEIDLDYDDYAEWKKRHPNLVSVRFQSEWGVDLVQRMLGRDREKDPAARAVLQEAWERWSWTNRYDRLAQAYWYMNRHIELNYSDLSMFESFRSANFLDHMAAARGATTLVSETTNTSDWNSEYRWDVSSMFIRGAARQFGGLAWHWYVACFFNGPRKDGTWVNNSSCGQRAKFGLAGGTSDSLERRVCYFAYLNGARAVEPESWEGNFFASNAVSGKMELTSRGRNFNAFHNFTAANPGRGATYAPVAILVPLAQGYNTCGGKAWGFCPYTAADNMVDGIFFTIAPGFDRRKWLGEGYEANLHNSRFAFMYDVLVPDTPQKDADFAAAIAKYPVAVLAGEYRRESRVAEKLSDYVREGGTLFLSASQLDLGFGEDVAGVRLSGKMFEFSGEFKDRAGKTYSSQGEYECEELVLSKDAKPFLVDDKGRVLCAVHRFGKGRVVTAAARWLVPKMPGGDGNYAVHLTRIGKRRFAFIEQFLDSVQDKLFPVKVEGDAQFGLNRTANGWWFWCLNNRGVKKFADTPQEIDHSFDSNLKVDISRLGGIRECRELVGGGKKVEVSGGVFNWKLGAGEVAVFEIKE